ncbi:MAG: potassium channel family protein [Chloroflexia bacterium]
MRHYPPRWRRHLLANGRAIVLLWRRFRLSLSLFGGIVGFGSLVLWLSYVSPQTGERLTYPEALYATLSLLFFESTIALPHGPLQVLFFVIPILGLSVVAEGLVRFSLLLLDRRNPTGEWTVALASTYHGHIVVCGLGHVGYRVVKHLLEFGQEVVAIERNPDAPFLDAVRRMGVPVLLGDASDAERLREAGVERAQAVIVATNDDLMNLRIVLNVRSLNPEIRIVLRMFDGELAERLGKGLGIRTAFSTSAIAAPAFATAAIHEGVSHSFVLEGDLLHISEIVIRSEGQLCGHTVQEIEEQLDLSVVFHQRGERRDMHPASDLRLEAGDRVLVFASLEQLARLERLNCPASRKRKRLPTACEDAARQS